MPVTAIACFGALNKHTRAHANKLLEERLFFDDTECGVKWKGAIDKNTGIASMRMSQRNELNEIIHSNQFKMRVWHWVWLMDHPKEELSADDRVRPSCGDSLCVNPDCLVVVPKSEIKPFDRLCFAHRHRNKERIADWKSDLMEVAA